MKKALLLGIVLFTSLPFFLKAQTLYFGGSGSWTDSAWGTSTSGPYTTAWISGRKAQFDIPNSTITGASISFSAITANENVTVTSGGTINTGGTIAPIKVASGKTFDFGSQKISTAGGTGLIKNGPGILAIQSTSSLYPVGITINEGTLICAGVNALGGGSLVIHGGILAGSGSRDFSGKQTAITFGGDFTLGATTGLASSTADLTFDAPVSLEGSNRIITLNGTGTNTFSGIISSTGGGLTIGTGGTGILVLSGANTYSGGTTIAGGTLVLSGVNTYSGSTTLSGGTLTLGAAGVIPDASNITFNGGTLKSGVTTGFSEAFSTLALTNNTTLALGTGAHSLNFAASNAIAWTTGKTLTITGWAGPNNGAGTAGKIFFGNSVSGLTSTQLSQIKFFNGIVNSDATILSTGEVVPTGTLPIQLTTFTGKAINQSILLNWNTASETNNDFYDVLRSADGKSFASIGTIRGAGTTTSSKDYTFSDENPYAGTNYYQLAQHDFDGKTAGSAIIPVDSKIDATKLRVYANVSSVKISISSPNKTKGLLHVFDITGRKLSESSIDVNKGFNNFDLPLTLISGVHFARYTFDNEVINQKFIK
jgi:autotransporter-associated beta strand protein